MSKIHVLRRATRSLLALNIVQAIDARPGSTFPRSMRHILVFLSGGKRFPASLLIFVIQVNRNAISTWVTNLVPADFPAEDNEFCTTGICALHSRNGESLICLDVWEVPHGFFGQRYMVALSWKLVIHHKNLQWVDFLSTLCAYMDGKSRGCHAASINFLGECVMP